MNELGDSSALEVSYSEAQAAKKSAKVLLKSAQKYSESVKVSNADAQSFCTALTNMYNNASLQRCPHIDVAKYLRLFSATLQSINAAQLDMISLMTSGVIEPLKNYADFDFLEMQNTKKKVIATAGEFESLCAKIESAQGGKKFGISRKDKAPDPVQIAQLQRDKEKLKSDYDEQQEVFSRVLDQTHQKQETKLLKALYEFVKIQNDYHEKSMMLLNTLNPKLSSLTTDIKDSVKAIDCDKEGILLYKSTAAMQGGWQRQWFVLKDGFLHIYKSKKDLSGDQPLNIMLCTTRPPTGIQGKDSSCMFEIVTPDKKKPLLLQAETEKEKNEWLEAIQDSIGRQLNQNEPAKPTNQNDSLPFKILQAVDGNDICADCSAPNPDWASINLGILVCLECSGVHRNLGTHISKVRSTTLDTKAWGPESLLYMKEIGNTRFNQIYEYYVGENKITQTADRASRERFIRAKYAEKQYCEQTTSTPDELAYFIYQKVKDNDYSTYSEIIRYMALGANLEWQNPEDDYKNALHEAVIHGNIGYIELLIQNNISIYSEDGKKRTPMHHAALNRNTISAVILYKHGFSGASQLQCKDFENKTAVEIAFKGQADDIVSLLSGQGTFGVGITINDLYAGYTPKPRTATIGPPSAIPANLSGPAVPPRSRASMRVPTGSPTPPLQRGNSQNAFTAELSNHIGSPRSNLSVSPQPARPLSPSPTRGVTGRGRGRGRGRGNLRGTLE